MSDMRWIKSSTSPDEEEDLFLLEFTVRGRPTNKHVEILYDRANDRVLYAREYADGHLFVMEPNDAKFWYAGVISHAAM